MLDDGVVFGTWDNIMIRLWPNGTHRWTTAKFDSGGGPFAVATPAVDENEVIYHITVDSPIRLWTRAEGVGITLEGNIT